MFTFRKLVLTSNPAVIHSRIVQQLRVKVIKRTTSEFKKAVAVKLITKAIIALWVNSSSAHLVF